MPNMEEIRQQRRARESEILLKTFDLAAYGQGVDVSMSPVVKDTLGPVLYTQALVAEQEVAVNDERDRLRAEFEAVHDTYVEQRDRRLAEIEEARRPKNVTTSDLLQAAVASPEQLMAFADLCLDNEHEDGVLLALQAALQQDYEDVSSHIYTLREDLAEMAAEIDLVEEDGTIDITDRWVRLAQDAPNREQLLRQSPRRG